MKAAKSEIGGISKMFQICYRWQWQETSAVINWFTNKKNIRKCIFMQFDIEAFYLSISKQLLMKALTYAKTLGNISDEEMNTIMHSRKFLIFNNTDAWF